MLDMFDAFLKCIDALDLTVIEKMQLLARSERVEQLPRQYLDGRVGHWLGSNQFARGVWTHQAEALRVFEGGANVVVSTSTASGKSLIFQAAALRLLDEKPGSAILVFYPLKALVADQLVSWRKILNQAGFPSDAVGRIDGDVLRDERGKIMQTARILIATPDVIQMSNLAKPEHKRFLSRLIPLP
jgi:DEAD/DEAH box helicase domain-containing protein